MNEENLKLLAGRVTDESKQPAAILKNWKKNARLKKKRVLQPEQCASVYQRCCRRLRISPLRVLQKQFGQPAITLNNVGFQKHDMEAVATALVKDHHTASLDLRENGMTSRDAFFIAELPRSNTFITHLYLSGNHIGVDIVRAMTDVLRKNDTLKHLALSDTNLTDKDGPDIGALIAIRDSRLYVLDLSHNRFERTAGLYIGKALVVNNTLEELDLSWNHLRGEGAVYIAKGLERNSTLCMLNISWNGFGYEGSCALSNALSRNITLETLDLTCNRINQVSLLKLLDGLVRNKTLEVLQLGDNPIPAFATNIILEKLIKAKTSNLRKMDLRGVIVDKEFNSLMEKMNEIREFEVTFKDSLPIHKLKQKYGSQALQVNSLYTMHPLTILYHLKKNLRSVDFFKELDSDKNNTVSRKELADWLKKYHYNITGAGLDTILAFLDRNKDGEINMGEIVEGERRYRRMQATKKIKESSRSYKKPFDEEFPDDDSVHSNED